MNSSASCHARRNTYLQTACYLSNTLNEAYLLHLPSPHASLLSFPCHDTQRQRWWGQNFRRGFHGHPPSRAAPGKLNRRAAEHSASEQSKPWALWRRRKTAGLLRRVPAPWPSPLPLRKLARNQDRAGETARNPASSERPFSSAVPQNRRQLETQSAPTTEGASLCV